MLFNSFLLLFFFLLFFFLFFFFFLLFPFTPSTASGTNPDRFHLSEIYCAGLFYLQILLHGNSVSIKKKKKICGQKYGVWYLLWIINLVCKFDLISLSLFFFFLILPCPLWNFRAREETQPFAAWRSQQEMGG